MRAVGIRTLSETPPPPTTTLAIPTTLSEALEVTDEATEAVALAAAYQLDPGSLVRVHSNPRRYK